MASLGMQRPQEHPCQGDTSHEKGGGMTSPIQCATCLNYLGYVASRNIHFCWAFAEIPQDILAGRRSHASPVEGDHGVVYSPRLEEDDDAGVDPFSLTP